VSAFDHADASLATGAPLLAVAEPAFLLLAFAFGVFGRAIGNANALVSFRFGCRLMIGPAPANLAASTVLPLIVAAVAVRPEKPSLTSSLLRRTGCEVARPDSTTCEPGADHRKQSRNPCCDWECREISDI
jgi:hypothetical protein